jgi:histone chaperone ASF1
LDNPTCFTNPFQFEITFECLQELDDDLEWKVLYVGSAQDASRDQILDEILVGPVPVGTNKFVLQADAPDPTKLAPEDLLGVTVVLVTCSYREREFVRVGYYVNNEYHNPAAPPPVPPTNDDGSSPSGADLTPPPPPPPLPNPIPLEHIQRQILADKPRVTKFPISWGDVEETIMTENNNNNDGGPPYPPIPGDNGSHHAMDAAASSAAAVAGLTSTTMTPNTVTPPGIAGQNITHNTFNGASPSMMMAGGLAAPPPSSSSSLAHHHDSSGIVSMQEESNMSHSYFGMQAMAE